MMAAHGESKPDIVLLSPVGSKAAVYKWPLIHVSKGQKIDGAEEIIETIRWVAREYPTFMSAIDNVIPPQLDFKSYDCIKEICDRYNKVIDKVVKLMKGTSVALSTSSRASQGLLKHIIQQVYNYAVVDPTELNKYSPFSSETYGETSFEFMAQLIEKNQFRPREPDTFIDLGSGVGHLVLQMAATLECKKCYGIEIADVPAGYAKIMEERFKFWMNWHGKTYTDFELIHGDFFDKQYTEIIKNSTHILVNNFAFKPDVDHRLKQKFLDLKDGTQILSSKPFCSPKSRLTERNLTDLGSIMHVVEIQPDLKKDTVSWTPKALPYYLHILDGTRVEKYYEKQKRRQGRSVDKGRMGKRRRTERGSDSLSDDSDDNTVYGPTTRKAWSEWCNSVNVTSCNRASTDSAKTSLSRNNSTDTETITEEKIEERHPSPTKEPEPQKIEKRSNSGASDRAPSQTQETPAQAKANQSTTQSAKSCLDKKRDYAIKKGGANTIQDAPPSALYSISKPVEAANGSSPSKIPNIVIKVLPTTEAKVVENVSKSAVEVKEPDENAKKLRQRKAAVKPDNKSTVAPPVATAAKGSRATKKPLTTAKGPAKSTAAPKKKASSPEKNSSLDFLHAKTVESVTSSSYHAQPAPGCEDHNFGSIVETPSLPRVVIKDPTMYQSTLLSQKNLDSCMSGIKLGLERFSQRINQPNTGVRLEQAIESERQRNIGLRRLESEVEEQIKCYESLISRAMKRHCDEFGITSSRSSIVSHLGALLKKNQELSRYCSQLEAAQRPPVGTTPCMTPPLAHSNSAQPHHSPYRSSGLSATLDLSIKQSS